MTDRVVPRLWLVLMDGRPHHLGDWWIYLTDAIDPKMAVRSYLRSLRSQQPNGRHGGRQRKKDLDQQIAAGMRRKIVNSFRYFVGTGYVKADRPITETEALVDTVIQLTELGQLKLLEKPTLGAIMNEMRAALEKGVINVRIEQVSAASEQSNDEVR